MNKNINDSIPSKIFIKPSKLKNHTLILDTLLPGDKSISHRAYMLASICENNSQFSNLSVATDCQNTKITCQQLGVNITQHDGITYIKGQGKQGLKASKNIINVGNSGTGIRLLTGLLSGMPFDSQISGDESIQNRPMSRIITPLNQMGAKITGVPKNKALFAPLTIKGTSLKGISYTLPVPSAQVKSAILFAGLYATGKTQIIEPLVSRDHSERMLRYFGADILCKDQCISITSAKPLINPQENKPIVIPNDMSAAAFFIVFAACQDNCTFILRKVSANPQRMKLIYILKQMGLDIIIENEQTEMEPYCDLVINSSKLRNIEIDKSIIAQIIDEIPILAIAGCFAKGKFEIKNAKELRVKESDRIHAMVQLLQNMGAVVNETEDGFSFEGPVKIKDFSCDSMGDHRIAMSAIIAAHLANVEAEVNNCECIGTSFPTFLDCLAKIKV